MPANPFQRKETAPGGVADQLSLGSLGFTGCSIDLSPASTPQSVTGTVGDYVTICPAGFPASTEIAITIEAPDGTVRADRVGSTGILDVFLAIGMRTGTYKVTGRQATTTANASFVVDLAHVPTAVVMTPDAGKAGTQFTLGLAGFPTGRDVVVDLYKPVPDDTSHRLYEYRGTLGTAHADGRGEALFKIQTIPGDPAGSYCAIARGYKTRTPMVGGIAACARFEIAA